MDATIQQKTISGSGAGGGIAASPEIHGAPAQAARGDDDLMSQPPEPTVEAGALTKIWKHQIGRAKRTWSKLAGADLAKVDGNPAKLADLLRLHYPLGDAEIDRQVAGFLSSRA
ncbi:MAG: hypothetical protein ISP90_18280 [Nevskia sp.]|nr:hypothetical protein [Nevskia sp.]